MTLAVDSTQEKKKKPASAGGTTVKRSTRKKAKDKPKRPLSAYNYFFKTERQRILKYLARKTDPPSESNDSEPVEEVVDAEQESKLVTEGGKVSFEEMGKLIGRRWKAITPEKLEHYNKLAAEDAERYKKELAEYNERKEKGAIHEAQRNAMLQMQQQQHHNGNGGRPDYYHPPPYHGGPSPASSMGMYGAPYSGGMNAPPYMGGPMYHSPHYGGGYPDYNHSGYNGHSSRGNESSYSQGGPPQLGHGQSHHPSTGSGAVGGPSSSSYPNSSLDPYGVGVNDYPPPSQSAHHSGEMGNSQGHGGPQPQAYGGVGGYPSQQYGSYSGPSPYGQGSSSDQHTNSSHVSNQRWG